MLGYLKEILFPILEDSKFVIDANGDKFWMKDGKLHRTNGPAVEYKKGGKEWHINGVLCRDNGPAIERSDGGKVWVKDGKFHRLGGPAVESPDPKKSEWWIEGHLQDCPIEVTMEGDVRVFLDDQGNYHRNGGPALICERYEAWYKHGKPHRVDGPAVKWRDGRESWQLDGKRHRVGGPAVKTKESHEFWKDGRLHREEGPAIESLLPKGTNEWWIDGVKQDHTLVFSNEDGTKQWHTKSGQSHRQGGPARILEDGEQQWMIEGRFHRDDGPAHTCPDGSEEWYDHGRKHRIAGPAVTGVDGTKSWYLNDELHREDGPAVEGPKGLKKWYRKGKLHRVDGPAIEWENGKKEYWLDGVPQPDPNASKKVMIVPRMPDGKTITWTEYLKKNYSPTTAELLQQFGQEEVAFNEELFNQRLMQMAKKRNGAYYNKILNEFGW
jgi:hypothetical protein